MKVLVLKRDMGEFGESYEEVIGTFLIDDDMTGDYLYRTYDIYIQGLFQEFKAEYLKTHKKFNRSAWDREFIRRELFFKEWIIKTYNLKPIEFDEVCV